jgi:hypothetical protein
VRTISKAVLLIAVVTLLVLPAMAQELPNSPKPKVASQMTRHERDAYLAKKYPDLLGIDKPVNSMGEAARTPAMVAFGGLFVGSVIADIEGTQHCVHDHTCRESNPILGQSRAQQYGVGIPLAATGFLCATYLRRHQHGSAAVLLLWTATTIHAVEATNGFRQ